MIHFPTKSGSAARNATTASSVGYVGGTPLPTGGVETNAMKLSAVYACVTILAESMSKLPIYIMDGVSKEHQTAQRFPILDLLTVRPNEAMTPSVRASVLESSRLLYGNSYDWLVRDPRTGRIVEMIPLPGNLVEPCFDEAGRLTYLVTDPVRGRAFRLSPADICHYKAYSTNGYKGISVLAHASSVIASGLAAQRYERSVYENGGSPSGVLTTDQDISGDRTVLHADGTTESISKKEVIRRDWERIHGGPDKAFRLAVLDLGLTYQPIAVSNRDAQFVENKEISVRDIARFFKVPLYKLQEGKQAYGSNEQNAIEYVVGTLHPTVTQYEQEMTYKLLFAGDVAKHYEVRMNMMAELRGDTGARAAWYKTLRDIGYFSVNDICALEDTPQVEGGDVRLASLNHVPLDLFRELSIARNTGGGKKEKKA
ncbi:MAG: phage portal protein [Oscillospiraceae bacterium]